MQEQYNKYPSTVTDLHSFVPFRPFPPGSVSLLSFGVGIWVRVGLRAGLVAGLWEGKAYGVFFLSGFGLAAPAPWLLHLRHSH